jgi:hypothetical protein
MAALTLQQISRDGLEPVMESAAGGGDTFVNAHGNRTFLRVDNGSGGDVDVTVTTTATVDGLAVADKVVTVTAGETRYLGPYQTDVYGETVSVAYESVTSVTVAALKL